MENARNLKDFEKDKLIDKINNQILSDTEYFLGKQVAHTKDGEPLNVLGINKNKIKE